MFVLGVTGGIGSGKTAATKRFCFHGITVVDADEMAHKVVKKGSPCLGSITEHFGRDILLTNGELDRKALREIIFTNDKERDWLENLLHPVIRKQTLDAIQKSTSIYTVLSAPLLLEKNLEFLTNRVLVIDCPEAVQIDRTCRRDNSSIESVQKVMQQQLSRRERTSRADDVIINDRTLEELNNAIDDYHFRLLKELNGSEVESNTDAIN